MSKTTISEFQFLEQFNTEEKAVQFFESARWPEGRHCPHCGSVETYPHKTRQFYYHCREKVVASSSVVKLIPLCNPASFLLECGFI